MKALVIHGKEDIQWEDREVPQPGDGEVRLRVGFVGICGSDLHYYFHGANGEYTIREPLIPVTSSRASSTSTRQGASRQGLRSRCTPPATAPPCPVSRTVRTCAPVATTSAARRPLRTARVARPSC